MNHNACMIFIRHLVTIKQLVFNRTSFSFIVTYNAKIMRKLTLLLSLLFVVFQIALTAQIQLTVELQPDNITYLVKLKPETSYSAPLNTTNNGQITFVLPTGGFQVGNVTNKTGLWSSGSMIQAPEENPSMDYLMFQLQSGTSDIVYVEGEEVELFSFENTGSCTGTLNFITEDDPFWPPNSQQVNPGILISVLGAGLGNAYEGSYGEPANCLGTEDSTDTVPASTGVITISDVNLEDPTICNRADGKITIIAADTQGTPLQYSIDGGMIWEDSNEFSNLESGIAFDIKVRDILGLNFADYGIVELSFPKVAEAISIVSTPACGEALGSVTIEATSVNPDATLRFSIDGGMTWQNTGTFLNLETGTYEPQIGIEGAPCIDGDLEAVTIDGENCPTEEEGADGSSTDGSEGNEEEEDEDFDGGDGGFDVDLANIFLGETDCAFAYVLEATDGVFTMSILSDTSFSPPFNITSTAQITIKVPTGDFEVSNFTNLINGVVFSANSRSDSPIEAPENDYISFGLDTRGTQGIVYNKGEKIPLFTFENGGTCTEKPVLLMNNNTDPFFPPNSLNANVSQQLTVSGMGGSGAPVCISNLYITDCGIHAQESENPIDTMDTTIPIDTMDTMNPVDTTSMEEEDEEDEEGPEVGSNDVDTMTINIPVDTKTTICLDSILTIDVVASTSLCSEDEDIKVTPIEGTKCIEIEPINPFSDSKTVCVVHCNAANVCDTTIISICPKVNLGDDLSICSGETVQLNPVGGSGTYQWTTTGDISCTDCTNPDIQPTTTTEYQLDIMTPNGCQSSDTISIDVANNPVIDMVVGEAPTECKENGSIAITLATENGAVQYSIDNGQTYQSENNFSDLAQGEYQILSRDTISNCVDSWSEVVQLMDASSVAIENIAIVHPSACSEAKGSLTIMVTADAASVIEYSIDDGDTWSNLAVFNDLEEGIYNVMVRIEGAEDCVVSYQNNPIELAIPEAASVLSGLADRTFCETDDNIVEIIINESISDFSIDGGEFVEANIQDSLFSFKPVMNSDTTDYNITLISENGCDVMGSLKVMLRNCDEVVSCGFFNGLDTLRAVAEDSMAVVCLPISDMDISEFEFLQDGISYDMTFGECLEESIFYGFNAASLGTPPFLLEEWIVNQDTLKDLEFSSAEELINAMNTFDQTANWVMVDDFGFIGVAGDKNYGPLKLLHIGSNTSLELQLNNMNVGFQSLMLTGRGIQSFIVRDTIQNCEDNLIIKIDDFNMSNEDTTDNDNTFPLDTLRLTTLVNTPLIDQCMTNSSTIIDSISIDDCGNPDNGFLLLQDNYCFSYTPNPDFVGTDFFCIVICSTLTCDTTYVQVEVTSDEMEIFTGFSPNNDGVNDFFTIKNIENFPQNSLEVFNRWGNRVYRQENYQNDWGGTFENLILPDGVYFYILKINNDNDAQDVHSGYLEIVR